MMCQMRCHRPCFQGTHAHTLHTLLGSSVTPWCPTRHRCCFASHRVKYPQRVFPPIFSRYKTGAVHDLSLKAKFESVGTSPPTMPVNIGVLSKLARKSSMFCAPLLVFIFKFSLTTFEFYVWFSPTQRYHPIPHSPTPTTPRSIMSQRLGVMSQRKIPFSIMDGDGTFPHSADGRGGGGPSFVSDAKTAAARFIQLRDSVFGARTMTSLAKEYRTTKQAISKHVKRWETAAVNDDEVCGWFLHLKDKSDQDAASALVAMQLTSTLPLSEAEKVRRDYIDAYKKGGLLNVQGWSVRAAAETASELYKLDKPLSRGSIIRSAKTGGLVSPIKAGRKCVLPQSVERSLVTDIFALRASKLVGFFLYSS